MDETTEPLIAVFGHPIAGHPAQFALEKAIKHLSLEHRVISFDVSPDKLDAALSGTQALGFRGVYLDTSLRDAATRWYQQNHQIDSGENPPATSDVGESDDPSTANETDPASSENPLVPPETVDRVLSELVPGLDCFAKSPDDEGELLGEREEAAFVTQCLLDHFESRGRRADEVLVVSGSGDRPGNSSSMDRLAAADIVVIPRKVSPDDEKGRRNPSKRATAWNIEQWPKADKLVFDMTDPADSPAVEERNQLLTKHGYTVVTARQIFVGGLVRCLRRWTGKEVSHEILADAVEEYTAV